MLSDAKIVAIYYIIDGMLKALRHYKDAKVRVSDGEIIIDLFWQLGLIRNAPQEYLQNTGPENAPELAAFAVRNGLK